MTNQRMEKIEELKKEIKEKAARRKKKVDRILENIWFANHPVSDVCFLVDKVRKGLDMLKEEEDIISIVVGIC